MRSPYNYLCVPLIISFKIAKKEEIVRRLEGDIANLQETVKSYAEEVRQSCFTINVRLICDDLWWDPLPRLNTRIDGNYIYGLVGYDVEMTLDGVGTIYVVV